MVEETTLPDLSQVAALPDTDDLPSANPQINKFNNAAKGPDGRFVSTRPKAETPNTDIPPEAPAEPLPEPQAETPPVAAPQRDPMLMALARRLSIPEQLIAQTDDNQLRENIRLIHQINGQGQPVPAPQAKAPEPDEDIDLGFDENEFDPKLYNAIKKVKDAALQARKENKQLKEQNQQFIQHQEQFRKQQETVHFDSLCAKHPEIFGAGSFNDLNPQSAEAMRRGMLYRQVAEYYQDKPWVNLDQAFQHFSQVFGAAKPNPTPTPPPTVDPASRISKDQWQAAGLLPASNRNGTEKPMTRFERLVREEAQRQNINGQAALVAGFDDNSDLPKAPR